MLAEFMRRLIRKKVQVVFNDLCRSEPVSRRFGCDRGTPVDRHYIEQFLAEKAELIRGRVLEVGDSRYTRRFGGEHVTGIDVLHRAPVGGEVTLIGDLTDLSTLPEGQFDCFICTQTFNFVYDVRSAVLGAHHLLRPGGVLLATVAGISQISRYDMDRWGDYWRFTNASARKLFGTAFGGGVEVRPFGNLVAALALLQGVAVEDLPDRSLLGPEDEDYQLIIAVAARRSPV